MNLKRFRKIWTKHDWLGIYLANRRGIYSYKRRTPQGIAEFKEYVRQKIRYIAVRPWDSLDLSASQSEKKLERITDSGEEIYETVEYDVLWHSNESPQFSRRMFVHNRLKFPSVGDLISGAVDHHLDRPTTARYVGVDAVIRRTYVCNRTMDSLVSEKWEIFLCPRDWMLESMKTDQSLLRRLQEKGLQVQGLATL